MKSQFNPDKLIRHGKAKGNTLFATIDAYNHHF